MERQNRIGRQFAGLVVALTMCSALLSLMVKCQEEAGDVAGGGLIPGTGGVTESGDGTAAAGEEMPSSSTTTSTTTTTTTTTTTEFFNCTNAPAFPVEDFQAQLNSSAVYVQSAAVAPSSPFLSVGFIKYVKVFGMPIVATGAVSEAQMAHASKLTAEFLDNDRDGINDNPGVLDALLRLRVVIGFLGGAEESYTMWEKKFESPKADNLKAIFNCNMHYLETWASDTSLSFHMVDRSVPPPAVNSTRRSSCGRQSAAPFDWTLWHSLFAITYYGYFETLDASTLDAISAAAEKAQAKVLFAPMYSTEPEMMPAEFFVWSLLTELKALECHCNAADINKLWKMCDPNDVNRFDSEYLLLLRSIAILPKQLPHGRYDSPTLIEPIRSVSPVGGTVLGVITPQPGPGSATPTGGTSGSPSRAPTGSPSRAPTGSPSGVSPTSPALPIGAGTLIPTSPPTSSANMGSPPSRSSPYSGVPYSPPASSPSAYSPSPYSSSAYTPLSPTRYSPAPSYAPPTGGGSSTTYSSYSNGRAVTTNTNNRGGRGGGSGRRY